MTAFLVLAALVALLCLCLILAVWVLETHLPSEEGSDVILVLGAQVKPDGTPSVQLAYRLETALSSYLAHPQTVICCGGKAGQEPEAEGTVMRAWLIARGVPEGDVLAETASGSTKENFRNALAMLPEPPEQVLVVTSDYHLPRAMAIARDLGLSVSGAAAPTLPEYWFKNRAREALGWGKYLLEKVVGK